MAIVHVVTLEKNLVCGRVRMIITVFAYSYIIHDVTGDDREMKRFILGC